MRGRAPRLRARAVGRGRRRGLPGGAGSARGLHTQRRSSRPPVRRTSRSSQGPQRLGMLADVAEHAPPVPQRPPREEAPVRLRVPAVAGDGVRDVPALPAGPGRAVTEVDLLAVHPKAFVEPAELLEHRPPEEEAAAEHPVGAHGLRRPLVEDVVPALVLERRPQPAQGRTADEGASDGREAAAGRLPAAIGVRELRARDATPRVAGHEGAERLDGPRCEHHVGIGDEDELARRRGHTGVDVGREAARARVPHDAGTERVGRLRAGQIGDHEHLVDLRHERGQRARQLVPMSMRDDDGGDLHTPSTSR